MTDLGKKVSFDTPETGKKDGIIVDNIKDLVIVYCLDDQFHTLPKKFIVDRKAD